MATLPPAVAQSVDRYIRTLRQRRRIAAVYVYGSQAKGTATRWSDIDLAVISPDFSADLFEERLDLMRLAAQIDDRIEPHPFTPEDFSASHPLACVNLSPGLPILPPGPPILGGVSRRSTGSPQDWGGRAADRRTDSKSQSLS